jgi:hypothetical protein
MPASEASLPGPSARSSLWHTASAGCPEAQIRVVLMVDRVELIVLHQAHQVGKIHSEYSGECEEDLQPFDEVVEVGDAGRHVVPDQEVGGTSLVEYATRGLPPEEGRLGLDPISLAAAAQFDAGSIPTTDTPSSWKYCRR